MKNPIEITEPDGVVWVNGEAQHGSLLYEDGEILIKTKEIITRPTNETELFYQVTYKKFPDKDGDIQSIKLEKPLRVKVKPLFQTSRPYAVIIPPYYKENIYPASSFGWYGRMLLGNKRLSYIIQEILNDNHYWLIILDTATSTVYHKHPIKTFEIMPIKIKTNWDFNKERFKELGPENPAEVRSRLLEYIDTHKISWPELASLTANAPMSCLSRGYSIRETLDYIIAKDFPDNVREELIFFLAWTLQKSKIPKTDSFDFNNELLPLTIARPLMLSHLGFILDKTIPLSYYKSLIMTIDTKFEQSKFVMDESYEQHQYLTFLKHTMESVPDWRGKILEYGKSLTTSTSVVTRFPVTKTEAKKSTEAWRARLGMLLFELTLRAFVRTHALGLNRILYIGSGYRWNHPHLASSIRFRDDKKQMVYINEMVMPPSSLEIAKRIFSRKATLTADGILVRGRVDIAWSGRAVNLSFFNSDENEWVIPYKRILRSVGKSSTKRKIENRFGKWRGTKPYFPNHLETKVIDMAACGIRFTDLEHTKGEQAHGISSNKASTILTKLRNLGILDIAYQLRHARLVSMASIIQGNPEQVCAVTHAFLENTPTASVFLGQDSNLAIIISRIPDDIHDTLLEELPKAGESAGLRIQCLVPEAYRNYTSTLYQRLRLANGEWDSDISALQAQASSFSPERDKENEDIE